jgi:VanZ family protein
LSISVTLCARANPGWQLKECNCVFGRNPDFVRVRRIVHFARYWLPPLLWMGMIFFASTDAGSFNHSSRIIGPIVRWFFPHIDSETLNNVVLGVRKLAHLTEYAFCAILLWRALRQYKAHDRRPWSWREARTALIIVVLYAISDEIHQCFVPGRQGAVLDVLLDSVGGLLGLAAIWAASTRVGRWQFTSAIGSEHEN